MVAVIQLTERPADQAVPTQHFDVLIVGAGLSGVAAAYHIKTECPSKSYAIHDGRNTIGGTWDLFRYPGVRSDSDMYTLGYGFRPWSSELSIAPGEAIRDYVRETAHMHGIDLKIRFGQYVTTASWDSETALWTLEAQVGEDKRLARYSCSFLFMCSGYYDYKEGYTPDWPGFDSYKGTLVHPQHWPEDLDYGGKSVVIIGSGATAVTLAPEMAKTASKVTVLQRSPTYIIARPAKDGIAQWVQKKIPSKLGGTIVRWKNVLLGMYFFNISKARPAVVKKQILKLAKEALGPDYDMTHFTPSYKPWDQRVCLIPDGDLFESIRDGHVQVVTDHIERFDEAGIVLKSGKHLDAEVVVTATGLKMQLLGGMKLYKDGAEVDLGKALQYKGMMFSDVPNLALTLGYTNASWTLKCELIANYVTRLLNYMDQNGYAYCTPRREANLELEPALNLTSGYVQRAEAILPKQGSKKPWKVYQNYFLDMAAFRFGKVIDGAMEFTKLKNKAKKVA